MLLEVKSAEYIGEYKIHLRFNNGEEGDVDLKETIFNDKRKLFDALKDVDYFKNFHITLNTIGWPNNLDLAPEYLRETMAEQSAALEFHSTGAL